MSISFNADEVFNMAERMEQDAAAYYHTAAEKVAYPGARQMLLDLAAWEEEHESSFADLHKKLAASAREDHTFDPYDEALQYLNALVDDSIFDASSSPLEETGPEPSFENILRFALGKEKETINFYTGLRQLVPANLGKDDVEKIIQEEMKHVTILNKEIAKVRAE